MIRSARSTSIICLRRLAGTGDGREMKVLGW